MAVSIKDAYHKCDSQGRILIIDKREKLIDFDKKPLDLYKGKYCMLDSDSVFGKAVNSDCLIKRLPEDSKLMAANALLRNVNRPNVVSVQNFYHKDNSPRLVFSWVDGSLIAWTKTEVAGRVLKTTMKGSMPTAAYRQVILDICSAMESLLRKKIYPSKLGPENIFIKKNSGKGPARAKFLVSEVIKVTDSDVATKESQLWGELKQASKSIFKNCATKGKLFVDPIAERFFDSIGNMSVAKLKKYPLNWTEEEKAKLLFWVMSSDKVVVSTAVSKKKLWPNTLRSGKLPPPFYQMIEHDNLRDFPSNYNDADPYDFLRICKNMIKHWETLPQGVKGNLKDVKGFVRCIDKLNPTIWCDLYELF